MKKKTIIILLIILGIILLSSYYLLVPEFPHSPYDTEVYVYIKDKDLFKEKYIAKNNKETDITVNCNKQGNFSIYLPYIYTGSCIWVIDNEISPDKYVSSIVEGRIPIYDRRKEGISPDMQKFDFTNMDTTKDNTKLELIYKVKNEDGNDGDGKIINKITLNIKYKR